jgi:hypothetical protein
VAEEAIKYKIANSKFVEGIFCIKTPQRGAIFEKKGGMQLCPREDGFYGHCLSGMNAIPDAKMNCIMPTVSFSPYYSLS